MLNTVSKVFLGNYLTSGAQKFKDIFGTESSLLFISFSSIFIKMQIEIKK